MKKIQKIKGFLFDLDGVLTDTAEYHYLAWKQLSDELGLFFDRKINEQLKGVSRLRSFQIILEKNQAESQFTQDEILQLIDKKNEYYKKLIQQVGSDDLLPGIRAVLLEAKKRGIKLAVASASKNASAVLEGLQIASMFDYIADAGKIQHTKPNPEVFLDCMKHLELNALECIAFEDAAAGIEAIHAANIVAVGIGESTREAKPDIWLSKTAELSIEKLEEYVVDKSFCITEHRNNRQYTKYYEGVFAQGSGYLQIRGSYEEGLACAPQNEEYMRMPANVTIERPRHPYSKWGVYVPGITGKHPLLKEELVNLPYILALQASVDDISVDMEMPQVSGYSRTLDMRDGVLTREFDYKAEKGVLHFIYRRYLPKNLKQFIVQEVEIQAISGDCGVHLQNDIDCDVRTNGYNHFTKTEKFEKDGKIHTTVITDTGDQVHMLSALYCNTKELCGGEQKSKTSVTKQLKEGESLSLTKFSLVSTSRDDGVGLMSHNEMNDHLEQMWNGRDSIYPKHVACWNALWECAGISIEGCSRDQLYINFCIYHLLRSNTGDSRVAICAKGFAGEAYFGHFFWDTEVYLLPFFLYTNPELALPLLEFRINTLEGAKENAKCYGYEGARYPWESSVTGLEQCPNWQYADNEVHVTADVVHGLWHAYKATEDEEFLRKAAPVFIETSKYWLTRVEKKPDGSIRLNGVMGPDEYLCQVNNNAYTNWMVAKALRYTKQIIDFVGYEFADEKEQKTFVKELDRVADGLLQSVCWEGIIPQCDHFEELEEPDFKAIWKDRRKLFGTQISQEKNYRIKALKQADVLMLFYLFPKCFTKAQLEQNYDFYFPYTTHDSSLSIIIHSILCSWLGREQEAYELFEQALDIDLNEEKKGASEGIHIAGCGGIWQGVVMGFAGMEWAYDSDKPCFHPHLPPKWKSLTFKVQRAGVVYQIHITSEQTEITLIS